VNRVNSYMSMYDNSYAALGIGHLDLLTIAQIVPTLKRIFPYNADQKEILRLCNINPNIENPIQLRMSFLCQNPPRPGQNRPNFYQISKLKYAIIANSPANIQ
ncbi:27266_t:CDS:1, partial [Racocetra persica]